MQNFGASYHIYLVGLTVHIYFISKAPLETTDSLGDGCTAGPVEFELPLQVVLYPDPRLRAKNKYINVFDEKLQLLVEEMFELMYK